MRRTLFSVNRNALYRASGIALLALSALWSGHAIVAEGPVVDESPHLAAGISYVQLRDYRLNPEHPPLEKLAAGIAASFADPVLPTDASWWPGGINEQWRAGEFVLWSGANDTATVLALGRIGVLVLNFLFLIAGWRLLAKRWGEGWALGFLTLVAASPFFLGHAHLVTTDVAAASAAVLACFAFADFLKSPSWRTGGVTALVFGLAQLTKFSLVLLIPTFLVAAFLVAYRVHGRKWRAWVRPLLRASTVMLAGYALVVYPTYAVLTSGAEAGHPRRDAAFLLGSFAGGPMEGLFCNPLRCVAELTILASDYAVLRPAATYGLGVLMVVQRSAGGNTIYFDGEVGSSGSRLYFPYTFLGKETVPALLVLAIGLGYLAWISRSNAKRPGFLPSAELVMGIFAVLYLASTIKSSLNIGIRHLFPVIPIAYLFALSGWRRLDARFARARHVLAALVALQVAAGISSLPYPLSYYNGFAGGTDRGYLVAADSNYDWGQDALRLRDWIDANPHVGKVAIDLFGASDPEALVGERAVPWASNMGSPEAYGVRYLAVSVNVLLNATGTPVPGEPRLVNDEYRWLRQLRGAGPGSIPEPDVRIGTSVFVYDLDSQRDGN